MFYPKAQQHHVGAAVLKATTSDEFLRDAAQSLVFPKTS
jgi:hypothetical protein